MEDVLTDAPTSPPGKVSRKKARASNPEPDHEQVTGSTAESVTREAIESRAYDLYETRGRQDGQDEQDWLSAERELRERGESS